MPDQVLDRMHARARGARTRATVRQWQYRQRHLAAGAWFRLRRALADAAAAHAISTADAQALVAEGYLPDACGRGVEPEKIIVFVDEARLAGLESRRSIAVRLGPDFLAASAVALVPFDEARLTRRREIL